MKLNVLDVVTVGMPLRLKHMFSTIVLLSGLETKHNDIMNALGTYLRKLGFDVDIDRTPV